MRRSESCDVARLEKESVKCLGIRWGKRKQRDFVRSVFMSMNSFEGASPALGGSLTFSDEASPALGASPTAVAAATRCRSFSSMDHRSFSQNPYHNANHVCDVLKRITLFCRHYKNKHGVLTLPVRLPKHTRLVLQLAGLLHDIGHRGHGSQEWSVNDKTRMRRSLLSLTRHGASPARGASLCSSAGSGEFVNLVEMLAERNRLDEAEHFPYNETHHILSVLSEWKSIQRAFGLKPADFGLMADIILQTDLSTYPEFVRTFKPTVYHVLVTFMKLADLGHFLEESFEMHMYWVFRVHHEIGTFAATPDWSISSIAKDTLWFGKEFVEPVLRLAVTSFLDEKTGQGLTSAYNRNMREWRKYVK